MKTSFYEAVGGLPTLEKVHKIFYDKIYEHPWLKQFFAGHNQQAIEDRQTSFMGEKMGGPKYLGKPIKQVHENMYITEELYKVRHKILTEALHEAGVPEVGPHPEGRAAGCALAENRYRLHASDH